MSSRKGFRMHELSLTQSILSIVDEYADRHGFSRVNNLRLTYGRMSCIDQQSLQFSFDILSKETIAKDATLIFDVKPVTTYCLACEKETPQETFSGVCPQCSSSQITITGGNEELQLVDMDVD